MKLVNFNLDVQVGRYRVQFCPNEDRNAEGACRFPFRTVHVRHFCHIGQVSWSTQDCYQVKAEFDWLAEIEMENSAP